MIRPRTQLSDQIWSCSFTIDLYPVFPSSGCPVQESSLECRNPFRVFQGCMRLLTLDNQPVDLIKVQQRLLGNYRRLQIDMCGITDRFVSRSHIWILVVVFFTAVTPVTHPTGVCVMWCNIEPTCTFSRVTNPLLFFSFCLTLLTMFPRFVCCVVVRSGSCRHFGICENSHEQLLCVWFICILLLVWTGSIIQILLLL